ncbi:MAG TPA: ABC transporter substrate-binding protein [Hyphomicrobiaceae bacterium]|nr:ABC transporter substrate-binding protein [Hyphomicrobiaceae bacterium]
MRRRARVRSHAEALRVYIERVNAAGGIAGKKINLILQDDSAAPGKAPANAKKLISQDNVICSSMPATRR